MPVGVERRLDIEFHASGITSDAGRLTDRDLDEVPGLADLARPVLSHGRRGKDRRHLRTGLSRQSLSGRLAGYAAVNDAERPSRGLDSSDGPLRDRVVGCICCPGIT